MIWNLLTRLVQQAWFYWFVRTGFSIYARTILGLHVEGAQFVPRTGGLIVAANHISSLDPPMVTVAVPRMIGFMAKQELFDRPWSRLMFLGFRAYPVRRGGTDLKAIKHSLELLQAGEAIGMFIQGTRNPGEIAALNGAAFLAQKADVPLQPTAVWREGRRFHVRFGPVLTPGADVSRSELTLQLVDSINSMLPEGRRMSRPA
jgi:1-acyl-sn-glycerol-3-phosphate acyltransferase